MLLKFSMSLFTLSILDDKEFMAIFLKGSRSGGVSSLVMSIMACAAFAGLSSYLPSIYFIRSLKCSCCWVVILSLALDDLKELPAKFVLKDPGSTMVNAMPEGSISCAEASLKPSNANLLAL